MKAEVVANLEARVVEAVPNMEKTPEVNPIQPEIPITRSIKLQAPMAKPPTLFNKIREMAKVEIIKGNKGGINKISVGEWVQHNNSKWRPTVTFITPLVRPQPPRGIHLFPVTLETV